MSRHSSVKGWSTEQIGDLVERVAKPVEVDKQAIYREIGVRSHGKGIFHKPPISGQELGNKRVFWVEAGCFVVNIVFAWEQAVARTTNAERGMIASHRFPMYRPKPDRLDLDYMLLFFNTPYGKHILNLASPGGAGRNKTLGREAFLELSIPVPPLPEQRQIAAILGAWDEAIRLTAGLIAAKQRRKKGLMQRLLSGEVRFLGFEGRPWREVQLSEVSVINPGRGLLGNPDKLVSFIRMEDVSEQARIIGGRICRLGDVSSGFTSFQNGDVLIAKITPCFENGKGALAVNLHNEQGFGSTEFHVLRSLEGLTTSEYLYYHTVSGKFRTVGAKNMQGSAGQQRVPVQFLRTYRLGLPPIDEQKRITAVLQACDHELDLLHQKLAALRQQKKGLMQRLLTGRVRVRASDE